MTPAERLAATKAKTKPATARPVVWDCRVRDLRTSLGLSLRDVEKATKVSNATICHVEAGHDPTLLTARRLALFFGKSVEELWPYAADDGSLTDVLRSGA